MTASRKLSRYKLDLVGVQEVKWEGGGTEPAGEYTFFYRKGNENHELGTGCYVHKRNMSVVKRVLNLLVIKTPWPQSASELYRPSNRCLSAKLVPTFLRIEGATWPA
jgi:hypothetical protein